MTEKNSHKQQVQEIESTAEILRKHYKFYAFIRTSLAIYFLWILANFITCTIYSTIKRANYYAVIIELILVIAVYLFAINFRNFLDDIKDINKKKENLVVIVLAVLIVVILIEIIVHLCGIGFVNNLIELIDAFDRLKERRKRNKELYFL